MLIRTQNKKGIVNLDNIDTIDTHDKQVRYFSGGGIDTMGLLGTYSTEEKAIKVLDMICEEYARNQAYIDTGKKLAFVPIKMVFQMPQDEEVEV